MINCIITSPKKTITYKNVRSITLPVFSGELQILPDHAESFIALRQDKIILENGKINVIPLEDGICHIKNNIATIILVSSRN